MKTVTYPVLLKADWPNGIECAKCRTKIAPGKPYAEVKEQILDNILTVTLICVYH